MGFIDKLFSRSEAENSSPELLLLKAAEKKIRTASPQLDSETSAYYIIDAFFREMCPGFAKDQSIHLLDAVLANGQIEKREVAEPRLRKLIDDSFPLLAENSIPLVIRAQLAENLWSAGEFATPIDGQKAVDCLAFFFANATEKQVLEFLVVDENLEFTLGGIEEVIDSTVSLKELMSALDRAAIRVPETKHKRMIASFAEELSGFEEPEVITSSASMYCSQCGNESTGGNFCTSCGVAL